jgi:lipopolysaccharide export system protein LptC
LNTLKIDPTMGQEDVIRPGKGQLLQRRFMALAKSGLIYDRYVLSMRIFLTVLALALVAALGLWPAFNDEEVSFTLSYEDVAASDDQIRMVNPRYVGKDAFGRVFTITAASGLQDTPDDPRIRLEKISASLDLKDNVKVLATSRSGTYFVDQSYLELGGDVVLETTDGYRFTGGTARFDLSKHTASSEQEISGYGPLGRFRAGRFEIQVDEKSMIFEGGIRMQLDPTGRGGAALGPGS